jgi:hypothetical protein
MEIFKILGAVLFSLGGGGAIVFGLSNWLGRVWANRILEEQKKEHQLEIENYKSQLTIAMSTINSINEKTLHISVAQYDKEFEIYQEIWEILHDCIIATLNLYPSYENVPMDEGEKIKWLEKKFSNFIEKYNLYSRTIDRYAPFYKVDFYKNFISVRNTCSRMGNIFKRYSFDVRLNMTYTLARDSTITPDEQEDVYTKIPKELEEKRNELQTNIHDYLKNLQVFQN